MLIVIKINKVNDILDSLLNLNAHIDQHIREKCSKVESLTSKFGLSKSTKESQHLNINFLRAEQPEHFCHLIKDLTDNIKDEVLKSISTVKLITKPKIVRLFKSLIKPLKKYKISVEDENVDEHNSLLENLSSDHDLDTPINSYLKTCNFSCRCVDYTNQGCPIHEPSVATISVLSLSCFQMGYVLKAGINNYQV